MVVEKRRLFDGQRDHFKQEWILREQLRLLSRPSWFGALSGLVLATLLVFLFSDIIAAKIRVLWFAFFCAASMVRLLANRLIMSNEDASLNDLEKKLDFYCFSLAGIGACWAATPFIFFVSGDWRSQSYLLIIHLGAAAGALSSLAFVKKTFLSFTPLVILPLMLRFLIEGGRAQTLFGLAGILYFILIVVTARMIAESIESSLKSTIENEFLMEETQLTNKKLKERTEQLKKAKEHAESASRIKGEFLSNMSHEIRTPLNAVIGFLELVLENASLPTNQRKQLMTAQISAKDLLGLINDILDLNKLKSGKLTVEQRPFNLAQLMQEIHEEMEIGTRKKGLDLRFEIEPSLSEYYVGDPLRIRQVMVNLVGNAIKFTEKGGITVRVLATDEEDQLHFVTTDTGIGIRAEQLNRIFDLFAQADTSMTRRFGGTGLGTTISKKLVELMGGRIWAESEEGKGSAFHFTVRMTPTDQPPEEDDLIKVPGRPIMPGYRRGFRTLPAESEKAMEVEAASGLELSQLDGVDTQKGLDRWQDPEAYAKALMGFSRDYANAADDMTRLVDEGDMEGALRLAHTLKGVAGNLSITGVSNVAAEINAALKEKRIDDVNDQIPTLVTALDRAVDSIKQTEALEDAEEMPRKEMDMTNLKELFTKMLVAFDEFSPYAVEPFLSELKGYLSREQLAPIVAHMERFDFDGAAQETIKLTKMLEISLEG